MISVNDGTVTFSFNQFNSNYSGSKQVNLSFSAECSTEELYEKLCDFLRSIGRSEDEIEMLLNFRKGDPRLLDDCSSGCEHAFGPSEDYLDDYDDDCWDDEAENLELLARDLINEVDALQAEIDDANQGIEMLYSQLRAADNENLDLEKQVESLTEQVAGSEAEIQLSSRIIDQQKEHIVSLTNQISRYETLLAPVNPRPQLSAPTPPKKTKTKKNA